MSQRKVGGIKRVSDGYWEHFYAAEPPPYHVAGKYLFFASDRELLVRVALDELTSDGFHHAKTHLADVKPPSGEYALCLYYRDDGRKMELRDKYRAVPGLKYRFWKSDQATRDREYSKEFLSKLAPEERAAFLRKDRNS